MEIKFLAYIGEAGPLTGAPRRLLTLVRGLRELNINVTVAAPKNSELFKVEDERGFSPIDISSKGILALKNKQLLTNKNIFFRLKVIIQLVESNFSFYRTLRKESFDVIWVRNSSTFAKYGLALLFSKGKVIWDVDDELPSHGIIRLLHELGMLVSHRVVFQYRGTEKNIFSKSINARYKKKYVTLIPGIEVIHLEPKKNNPSSDGAIRFIHVGTINNRKNQAFTLRLLGAFKEKHPAQDFVVEFAGFISEKTYKSELDNIIRDYRLEQNVKFLGWRSDVTELVESSDILLMPSLSEGVPNTVQEAMVLGVAVIGSTAGGIPEIIENGETGYSLELDDFLAWLTALEELIFKPELRMQIGKNARKYALNNFDNKTWVEKYHNIISTLVKN